MNQNKQTDLVQRCIKRDRKAQHQFYKEYFQLLFSTTFRYTRSKEKSLEVMNLGFAKVMLNLKKYDQKQPLEKWMKTIMINTVIDEFRKNKKYDEHTISVAQNDLVYIVKDTSHNNEFEGLTEVIQEKLEDMHPVTKDVFNLYAMDGYKHKEIAKMLDIPEGTCHYHYSVAKKTLREYINNEFDLGHSI